MSPRKKISYNSSNSKLYSTTSDSCKILSDTNKINTIDHEIQYINNSPNGKWNVETNDETTMTTEKSTVGNIICMQKALFANDDENKNEKSGLHLKINFLLFHYLNF